MRKADKMFENKMLWAYETMACHMIEEYQMPGVEDAFAEGSYCLECYNDAMDACDRLRDKLGVQDENEDLERMIRDFEEIQKELCLRMYCYGAWFGE